MNPETEQERRQFGARLSSALDSADYPPMQKGRADKLARAMDVSAKTASNWLTGAKLPQVDRMIDLSKRLGISFEWLATGRGQRDVLTPQEREHIDEFRSLAKKDRERVIEITHVFRGQAGQDDGDVA